ncbi:hypothetical protein DICPUDRAFT_77919 [Dictyostelium purpureum]|uniref:Uncharacterized protein n=1 Tax=Dictyostelium purpureum TaxID=5786 RepID=F0ZI12_DICPU|nr:uncharacterized protein DICPUDRAFT_77919 [Dictyostelium purpureum]EGC36413.1 hypothetical protein DICPUDRAFT_77919 [Dictyostelium purpureum]|eukprot:XP_003287046.1 hypothetical protein DICPUDRAFT_77919 [Dictyostelium purpureum]
MFRCSLNNLNNLLFGRNAIVTGGSRGIGLEIARDLANRGANVCIWSRNRESNDNALGQLPILHKDQKHFGIVHDLSTISNNPTEFQDCLVKVKNEFGPISILVHSAGVSHNELFIRSKQNNIEEMLHTNLLSPIQLTKPFLKDMMKLQYGRIIFIGSVVSEMGNKGQTIYSSTKSALLGFSKSLSKEVGHYNCTSNVIIPGFIDTDMSKDYINQQLIDSIPLKRIGNTKDISKTALFLIESDYITGQSIQVDGGLY